MGVTIEHSETGGKVRHRLQLQTRLVSPGCGPTWPAFKIPGMEVAILFSKQNARKLVELAELGTLASGLKLNNITYKASFLG